MADPALPPEAVGAGPSLMNNPIEAQLASGSDSEDRVGSNNPSHDTTLVGSGVQHPSAQPLESDPSALPVRQNSPPGVLQALLSRRLSGRGLQTPLSSAWRAVTGRGNTATSGEAGMSSMSSAQFSTASLASTRASASLQYPLLPPFAVDFGVPLSPPTAWVPSRTMLYGPRRYSQSSIAW